MDNIIVTDRELETLAKASQAMKEAGEVIDRLEGENQKLREQLATLDRPALRAMRDSRG